MKKLFLIILVLSLSGCSWKAGLFGNNIEGSGEVKAGTEAPDSVLKVQVSPYASSLITKRIGVIPFTGPDNTIGQSLSNAIADSLVISGLKIIESKYFLGELNKFVEAEKNFEETNEWEEFKRLFNKEEGKTVLRNLNRLRKLDLVDYVLTGEVNIGDKWFFFKGNKVDDARLDIISVQDGTIVISLNYNRDENGNSLSSVQLGEKLANALVTAMK